MNIESTSGSVQPEPLRGDWGSFTHSPGRPTLPFPSLHPPLATEEEWGLRSSWLYMSPERGKRAGMGLAKNPKSGFKFFLSGLCSFHFVFTAAPPLLVLKRNQKKTLCNVCLSSPLKFFPGLHPRRRTAGAGLILRPQRRVSSPLARAQVGWLPQVSASPALVSLCPGKPFSFFPGVLSWHFFSVSEMPGGNQTWVRVILPVSVM